MDASQSQDLKSIKIVYTALVAAILFFLVISSFIVFKVGALGGNDKFLEQVFLVVSTFFALTSIPVGIALFKKRLEGIEKLNLSEKIPVFRSAMILRAAFMEGAGYFFVVCFILTGSTISLVETAVIVALMLFYFPTDKRLAEEMKHDLREVEKVQEK